MKKIFIISAFLLIFAIGLYLFYQEGTLPINKQAKETTIFVIKRGENLNEIINRLWQEKLIRNRLVFYFIIKKLGLEKKIQAGDFRLSPAMDAYTLAKTLTHGTLDIWITFIEGLRKEEIAQIISQNFNLPETEFIKSAKEGYLFPDTYLIPKNATVDTIINILEKNFYQKFNKDLQEKARLKNLSLEEVLTIASLVEREAKSENDRKLVASVIFNRLKNEMKLDIDATVQYALGYQTQEKTWWKKNLTQEDLNIDSPYNTYKNIGLPPGPICNPGLSSIKAVIDAPKTDYFYYLSDKTGKTHFAKTLEEHNQNIQKYLK
ncbi:MAG: endolytic transglycosylase MltG [Patescibacteria group bacterium]|nr:endolytic transglycosylase MltG [Patescibacteria group bacterium]